MTDRALLEAAAKAADMTIVRHSELDDRFDGLLVDGDEWEPSVEWNPLTDDGDALRLAVKLQLEIRFGVAGRVYAFKLGTFGEECGECTTDDASAATRRAITRAAAAMGEKP